MASRAARLIEPASRPLSGRIDVPGSKSISNRAIILAALARGRSRLDGLLRSDDVDAMITAIETLGLDVMKDSTAVEVEGGAGRFPGGGTIDCGHGGTPARFLLAAACLADAPVTIDGSARLRERPIHGLVEALRSLGASIDYTGADQRLPVHVEPSSMRGGHIAIGTTATSQYISALMLIGPFLPDGLVIEFTGEVTSMSYVHLTAAELEQWGAGVELEESGGRIRQVRIRPGMVASSHRAIPPDASSLVYWATAAAIVPGSRIELPGVLHDDPQPDMAAVGALADAGLGIEREHGGLVVTGPKTIRGWRHLDAAAMPDGSMALSVAAACCVTSSTITGLRTLRVKESDRISALETELTRAGAEVRSDDDSLHIRPVPTALLSPGAPPLEIPTYDDHRMAMAFAILGLRRGGISVLDPSCVTKSYPGFWSDLQQVVE